VSLYAANPAVQRLKVVAVAVFALGMLGLRAQWRDELGRLGTGAALVLVLATVAGAVPYSVAEASLSPALAPAVAEAQLEATYAGHVWIGILASVAMPLILTASWPWASWFSGAGSCPGGYEHAASPPSSSASGPS
jgi:hypothetical protein